MSQGVIKISEDKIKHILGDLTDIGGKMPVALSRSINRAVSSAKTAAVKQVRNEYTAKAGDINKTIKVKRANPSKLEAQIFSSGASLPLSSFKVSPKTVNPRRRKPLNVEVRRGGGGSLGAAFMARMPNGKVGVFERTGKFSIASRGAHSGKRRENIEQKFGPSVPVMLNADSVTEAVELRAIEVLDQRLPHEINRILGVR